VKQSTDQLDRRGASFDFAQDEDFSSCHQQFILTLSEVEGRTVSVQRDRLDRRGFLHNP
jgi:hypothetical protein